MNKLKLLLFVISSFIISQCFSYILELDIVVMEISFILMIGIYSLGHHLAGTFNEVRQYQIKSVLDLVK